MPAANQYFIVTSRTKPFATLYTWLPNMPKNTAALQKRIQHAVRVLRKNRNLSVPEAMKMADFLKKDVANKSIHQAIQQCKMTALAAEGLHIPPCKCIVNDNRASLLDVSNLTDAQTMQTLTTTTTSMTLATSTDNAAPIPKRKQIQLQLHSVQQKRRQPQSKEA